MRLAVMGTPEIDVAVLTQLETAVMIDLSIGSGAAEAGTAALAHHCV
jgi:hypothetical protein